MDDHSQALAHGNGLAVHSGFPNPALELTSRSQPLSLDLNQLLVRHPSSTFLFRISGHSWADQGIFDGDIALVDRSRPLQAGSLVIGWQSGGFVIYRWHKGQAPAAPWGVITSVIHEYGHEL